MDEKVEQQVWEYISSSLPHGLMAQYYGSEEERYMVDTIDAVYPYREIVIGQYGLPIEKVNPILRPMDSMTIEELKELESMLKEIGADLDLAEKTVHTIIQWFLKKHLDYLNFIEKGCAVSVEKDNNPYA